MKSADMDTKKLTKVAAFLLFLGTSLLPVYVFSSGGMQPAHFVLFSFSLITLLSRGFPINPWSVALIAMFVYAFTVESIYGIFGSNPRYVLSGVFFFFNLVIVTAVYLHIRETGLKTLQLGILVAAAIALGTVSYSGVNLKDLDGQGRPSGAFNNPNQLGYFSVCLLSTTYLLYRGKKLNYWMAAAVFSVAIFLAVASLSKAAMISNFAVIVLAMKPVSSRKALLGWSLVGLLGLVYLFKQYQSGAFEDLLFAQRLMNITNESDSSLESRGYFAFIEGNALQLILGMGANNINDIVGHEVHSTFDSVLNNYGLLGLMIFSTAMLIWVARLWQAFGLVGIICVTSPPMLYGITHNGTRFTFFWLLFAASMALAERERRTATPIPTTSPHGSVRV